MNADSSSALPPEIQDPIVPYPGYWSDAPTAWAERAAELADACADSDARLVFLGDSITQAWASEGRESWEAHFAPLGAINLGIGGDRTNQVLWRIDHGTLDRVRPEIVVLNIGVNNFWTGGWSAEKIADGIEAVVHRIRDRLPAATVVNIGILPLGATADDPLRQRATAVNALLAERADGERWRFIDLSAAFLEPDGTLDPAIAPDLLHLSPAGYARYAPALLRELPLA